ncbi:ATP-binding protein [Streptomyces armeniacus]|uniref:ATP-binding protein n=1 Tax=Streptomyces armeniacus TaxID=83291 RepID=A0A345XTH5_9ACTN|nr:ATP-binding protein [Streptomyces armeniacus]AXK34941.1 ATP-binding protein [Streptomyces armeniacus]
MPEATQRFFDPRPEAVRMAREFACLSLASWRRAAEPVETVRLCVSELASNALLHGAEPGRGFLVRLALADDVVRLEVHDSREVRPEPRRPSALDTAGRGLLLVAELADDWGVADREPFGKIVWARIKAPRR